MSRRKIGTSWDAGAPRVRMLPGVSAIVTLLALAGCSNTSSGPEAADQEDTPTYTARTSPAGVLARFREAYVAMDAEAYVDCLSDDFEFFLRPEDVGNPDNPLPEFWDRSEEQAIHERMFSDPTNVDEVRLTMTTVSIEFDPGDDLDSVDDDVYTYRENTDLRVYIGNWIFLGGHSQEFSIRVDPDETGRSGETLWEIEAWSELDEWEKVESSWGMIKSMYR